MKVLVIAETNWIEDIALVQDLRSAYLHQLKDERKIGIAVPVYSLHEADGSLDKKIAKRIEEIDNFLHFLGRIGQSKPYESLCSIVKNSLKEFKSKSLAEKGEIKRVLNKIKIYAELEDVDVELHFDAGEVVERIFEVIE